MSRSAGMPIDPIPPIKLKPYVQEPETFFCPTLSATKLLAHFGKLYGIKIKYTYNPIIYDDGFTPNRYDVVVNAGNRMGKLYLILYGFLFLALLHILELKNGCTVYMYTHFSTEKSAILELHV